MTAAAPGVQMTWDYAIVSPFNSSFSHALTIQGRENNNLPCRILASRWPWQKSMARRCSLHFLLVQRPSRAGLTEEGRSAHVIYHPKAWLLDDEGSTFMKMLQHGGNHALDARKDLFCGGRHLGSLGILGHFRTVVAASCDRCTE